ncbi:hypothetical protein KDH_27900 [Dictyobacter sp. S3.2.2.5]|uniref:Uncharacterized protein n=1 Tax=Dictyobacter halimunensis TaxID=3026934 RepID=A0ABQ6FTZ5_9CHLR|nr:hypothetical protein KDH_27900 [Dictyobacter sp. S3.2.2.5]
MNNSLSPRGLRLTAAQAHRMIQYIQRYRHFAWEQLEPTAERNMALRALQALQGQIMSQMEPQNERITLMLPILPDERLAMKMMINHVLEHYEGSPPSKERSNAITELTGLKSILESDIFTS